MKLHLNINNLLYIIYPRTKTHPGPYFFQLALLTLFPHFVPFSFSANLFRSTAAARNLIHFLGFREQFLQSFHCFAFTFPALTSVVQAVTIHRTSALVTLNQFLPWKEKVFSLLHEECFCYILPGHPLVRRQSFRAQLLTLYLSTHSRQPVNRTASQI